MERWAESKQPSESKTTPRAKQKKKWERRKYTQGLLHCKGVPPWRGYIVIEWYRVVEVIPPSVWLVISFESWFSPWRDEQSAQVAEPWYWILDHTRMRHKIPPVCPNSLFVLSAPWMNHTGGMSCWTLRCAGTAKHESTVVAQDWVQAQRPFQPQLLLLPGECATT